MKCVAYLTLYKIVNSFLSQKLTGKLLFLRQLRKINDYLINPIFVQISIGVVDTYGT